MLNDAFLITMVHVSYGCRDVLKAACLITAVHVTHYLLDINRVKHVTWQIYQILNIDFWSNHYDNLDDVAECCASILELYILLFVYK